MKRRSRIARLVEEEQLQSNGAANALRLAEEERLRAEAAW